MTVAIVLIALTGLACVALAPREEAERIPVRVRVREPRRR